MSTDAPAMAEILDAESRIVSEEEIQSQIGFSVSASLASAEIDTQIATAKKYPRSITTFLRESTGLITTSQTVADESFFALKRRGKDGQTKNILGPSIRFAEILASMWGNCRSAARIVGEEARYVVSQGAFFDLEKNAAITTETRRRITTSKGYRFSDDMIAVTANAACSIALRNAILRGIPKAIWDELYQTALQVAAGQGQTMAEKRNNVLTFWQELGVDERQLFHALRVNGANDITLEHCLLMRGAINTMKAEGLSVEDTLGLLHPEDEAAEEVNPDDLSNAARSFGKKKTAAKKKGTTKKKGAGRKKRASRKKPPAEPQENPEAEPEKTVETSAPDPALDEIQAAPPLPEYLDGVKERFASCETEDAIQYLLGELEIVENLVKTDADHFYVTSLAEERREQLAQQTEDNGE